ncbi:SDR family oxidoreductase [Sphingomonas colocasiae]|uniref:SDR family oxidoreductase n=1 Tax=Sphingomonas colocasiae TaxID=1848973 RepID=A0ABS7PWA5_9SPHN|nr:SDR family oxidoreductase [Sphingomonas colocasiae]
MDSLFSLAGRNALVTGGARGLGRMIAQGLIGAGANVFITARKEEDCRTAALEIGTGCTALPGDAGSPEGIAALGAAFRQSGEQSLHILVNNAGRTWGAPFDDFPDKAWPGVMAVNVQAPFRMVQEFMPELIASATAADPARVINIGSIAGLRTTGLSAYSYAASKAAIHHLGRQLARDLVDRHINVNTLHPGYFPTAMTAHLRDSPDAALEAHIPMRRLGRPADIAGAIVFLASPAGAYVTGAGLSLDGGIEGCS